MQHKRLMQGRFTMMILVGLMVVLSFAFSTPNLNTRTNLTAPSSVKTENPVNALMSLYDSLDLGSLGLSQKAFDYAVSGYEKLLTEGKIKKDNVLSILDFSLSSDKKRLFVLDLTNGELIYQTYVAHGRNSGTKMATKFSNQPNSFQSSLGFYITGDVYQGKHGMSLRLEGEEKGINDKAMERGIVMHSADYVDESLIAKQGYIGRSQGCPALPGNIYQKVIKTIQNGSCLFVYSPDKFYVSHSGMLNNSNRI